MHVFVRLPPLLLKSKECETFTRSLSLLKQRGYDLMTHVCPPCVCLVTVQLWTEQKKDLDETHYRRPALTNSTAASVS